MITMGAQIWWDEIIRSRGYRSVYAIVPSKIRQIVYFVIFEVDFRWEPGARERLLSIH